MFEDQGSDAIREDVVAYRIERDRVTRSVERGKNLMIQTPFLPGGSYWFTGRVWAVVSPEEAAILDRRLVQGFRFVPAIGAETTVGYGVVADAEVTRVDVWTEGSGMGANYWRSVGRGALSRGPPVPGGQAARREHFRIAAGHLRRRH